MKKIIRTVLSALLLVCLSASQVFAADMISPFPADTKILEPDNKTVIDGDQIFEPAYYNGHTYQIIYVKEGEWNDVAKLARSLDGYLACLTDSKEDEFAYDLMKSSGLNDMYFGFSDQKKEGEWVWESGEKTEYTNWGSGEPNNQGNYEHFAMYYRGSSKWNDGGGVGKCAYLIEWDEDGEAGGQDKPDSSSEEAKAGSDDEGWGELELEKLRKSRKYSEENIKSYDNGDSVYIPTQSMIAEDEKEGCLYITNLLDVYLTKEVSETEAEKLAESVDGILAGQMSGIINSLQIYVKETELDGLREKAAGLMKSDLVMYAAEMYPIEPTLPASDGYEPYPDPKTNTREANPGDGEKNGSPDGNDDAYEAVGAYAGWELADLKAGVIVGLMDNGVQNDHEELDGKIRHLSGEYSTDYPNPDSCHGTATASIIAAKKNGKGIRGIADNAEIISVGIYEREMDGTAVVTFLEYREIIKQMIENGASIICLEAALSIFDANHYRDLIVNGADSDSERRKRAAYISWYNAVMETEGEEDIINRCKKGLFLPGMDNTTQTYAEYLEKRNKADAERTAYDMIFTVSELMNGGNDFLIIQAAGNGLNWTDSHSLDAGETGGFAASVTKDKFNWAADKCKELKGLTYDDIKNHLIIVSGTTLKRNDDGSYKRDGTNNGKTVDICAPSEHVLAAWCSDLDVKDKYGWFSGSSSATPLVAGAAALLWSCAPALSSAEVKECLVNGHVDRAVKWADKKITETYPMLNVGGALKYAAESFGVVLKCDDDFNGLWVTFSSIETLYYFDNGEVTCYTKTDITAPLNDRHYHKEWTQKYTIEKMTSAEGPGQKVVLDNGAELWLLDNSPDVIDYYFHDTNGDLTLSGSSSLMRVTDFTVDDLILEDAALTSYADVVRQYEGNYGKLTFVKSDGSEYYIGVFLAKLIDFDQDGSDELLVGYSAPLKGIEQFMPEPKLDVWTMKNGVPVQVYEGAIMHHGDIGSHCAYVDLDGKCCLCSGYSGYDTELSLLSFENGSFTEHLNLKYDGDRTYMINGQNADENKWNELYQKIENNPEERFHSGCVNATGHESKEVLKKAISEDYKLLGM